MGLLDKFNPFKELYKQDIDIVKGFNGFFKTNGNLKTRWKKAKEEFKNGKCTLAPWNAFIWRLLVISLYYSIIILIITKLPGFLVKKIPLPFTKQLASFFDGLGNAIGFLFGLTLRIPFTLLLSLLLFTRKKGDYNNLNSCKKSPE